MDPQASTSGLSKFQEVCPLCNKSTVTWFTLNRREKLWMCSDNQCDFPFGYEPLKFLKLENVKKEKKSRDSSLSSDSDDMLYPECMKDHMASLKGLKIRLKKAKEELEKVYNKVPKVTREEIMLVDRMFYDSTDDEPAAEEFSNRTINTVPNEEILDDKSLISLQTLNLQGESSNAQKEIKQEKTTLENNIVRTVKNKTPCTCQLQGKKNNKKKNTKNKKNRRTNK